MSYRQKSLGSYPGLWCERLEQRGEGMVTIISYLVISPVGIVSSGRSAASAWKRAYHKVEGKED